MVFNESILERYLYSKATNELKNKLISLNQSFSFYVGYSYTNRLDRLNENQSICKIALELGVKTIPLHNCRYLIEEDIQVYEALTQIGGHAKEIKDYEDYSFDNHPLITEELTNFINQIHLNLYPKKFLFALLSEYKRRKCHILFKCFMCKGTIPSMSRKSKTRISK